MGHSRLPLIAGLMAFLMACDPAAPEATTFPIENCRKVELIDAHTSKKLRGAEDLVVHPDGDRVILSVYDRWATEKALRTASDNVPHGGLYSLPTDKLELLPGQVRVKRLTRNFKNEPDFHPHGIDIFRTGDGTVLLASVTRTFKQSAAQSPLRKSVIIDIFSLTDDLAEHRVRVGSERLCNANDVAFIDRATILVTTDHRACTGFAKLTEQILGRKSSTILLVRPPQDDDQELSTITTYKEGFRFANGIAKASNEDRLFIAATREKIIYQSKETTLTGTLGTVTGALPVPGHPDNLSMTPSGTVIAALHPNLIKLSLYRYHLPGGKSAGSKIVSVDPDLSVSETLFSDRSGKTFSAATSAVMLGDWLIAGSVADAGVLVCKRTKGP